MKAQNQNYHKLAGTRDSRLVLLYNVYPGPVHVTEFAYTANAV